MSSAVMDQVIALARQESRGSPENLTRAVTCVRHFLACAIMGLDLDWSRAALDLAEEERRTTGGATVVGLGARSQLRAAIFANSVLAQSTLAEDVDRASLVHPGSVVVPASLACAESIDASGTDFLYAVVVGYDVATAVGAALKSPSFVDGGFRPSGVFGVLGAAAACAWLLRFDDDEMASCLGVAGNMAGGLREWANAGSTDIYVQNGQAAANGFWAAKLVQAGFSGPRTALEGRAGMGFAFARGDVRWKAITEALETEPAVSRVEFKRFPACSAVQTVLEVAVELSSALGDAPVEAVTVRTHAHGKDNPGCDSNGPWNDTAQAQMSNQLGVALALSRRPMTVAGYAAGREDPAVVSLASRVVVEEDERMTACYPERSMARVEVQIADGRMLIGTREAASPLTTSEVERLLVSVSEGLDGSRALLDALERLQYDVAIGELCEAIRGIRRVASQ